MRDEAITNARLHHLLVEFIIARGFAPDVAELVEQSGASEPEVRTALKRLEADHGVVLHPDGETIWILHPFALAPTSFVVRRGEREWWGTCAWCSLGLAALVGGDPVITTALGASECRVGVTSCGGSPRASLGRGAGPSSLRSAPTTMPR